MAERNEHRCHIRFNALALTVCHADQLDAAAHLLCVTDIIGSNACDTLGRYIFKAHAGIERDGCQDRHLAGCVESLHICRRIGLSISELRRKCQCLRELHSLLCHFGQNKIRRAVYDAHDLGQMICCKGLLQRCNDRNRSCHCRLKHQITAVLLSDFHEMTMVRCNQILIGGHDMLSGRECLPDVGPCRLDAAHQFDHDLDRWIIQYLLPVIRDQLRMSGPLRCFCHVADKNLLHLRRRAQLMYHLILLCIQYLPCTKSHRTKSENCHAYRSVLHRYFLPLRHLSLYPRPFRIYPRRLFFTHS